MIRVEADDGDIGANADAFAIQINIAAFRAVRLDNMTKCSFGLVTDEEHVMSSIGRYGFFR